MMRWQEFKSGVAQQLPLQIGVVPFGMVFGILGLDSGMTAWQTMLLSSILFAGTSQIVFAQLVAIAAPPAIFISSVAALNARHMLYSASMADYLRHLPLRWRLILAYLLTDEAYAVSIIRYQEKPANQMMHYHLLGSGLTLWLLWQIATATGILAGQSIPASLELGFAIPLIFMAIIIPLIKSKIEINAILAAGVVVITCQHLPYNSWLILAAITGVAAGTITYLLSPSSDKVSPS